MLYSLWAKIKNEKRKKNKKFNHKNYWDIDRFHIGIDSFSIF